MLACAKTSSARSSHFHTSVKGPKFSPTLILNSLYRDQTTKQHYLLKICNKMWKKKNIKEYRF